MAGKKFSLRLCPETEAILAAIPRERRSAYVRQAILFYHNQGIVFRRVEEKLDLVITRLEEGSAFPGQAGQGQGSKDNEVEMETYLFSGQDEIFGL